MILRSKRGEEKAPRPYKGYLIALEGVSGVGKTTILEELSRRLQDLGYAVYTKPNLLHYREKGIGFKIKQILSEHGDKFLRIGSPVVAALLIAAKRAYDIQNFILPALNSGMLVIADRAIATYYAYHLIDLKNAFPHISDKDLLMWLSEIDRLGGITPDMTFYLYTNFWTAIRRSEARDKIRYTDSELEYIRKLLEAYDKVLREIPGVRKIDVTDKTVTEVCEILVQEILKRVHS